MGIFSFPCNEFVMITVAVQSFDSIFFYLYICFGIFLRLECPLTMTKLVWEPLLSLRTLGFGEDRFAALFNTVTSMLYLFNIHSEVLSLALSCTYSGQGSIYLGDFSGYTYSCLTEHIFKDLFIQCHS